MVQEGATMSKTDKKISFKTIMKNKTLLDDFKPKDKKVKVMGD